MAGHIESDHIQKCIEETDCSMEAGDAVCGCGPHQTGDAELSHADEKPQALEPLLKRFRSEPEEVSLDGGSDLLKRNTTFQSEDEYEHIKNGLIYVTTSFPGAGLSRDLCEDHIQGCECGELCSNSCCCMMHYGCSYENGKLKESHYGKPIFECNDWCNCGDDCPNRVAQRGPVIGLEVLALPDKGFGVVSSRFIPRNSFVCEYAGEYIGVEEARVRFSRQMTEDSNYILVLKEHMQGTASGTYVTVIDPTIVGNIGRYINHSCDPNLVVVPVRVNGVLPVAALFALRDILPGEELCYDYSNTVRTEEREESTPRTVEADVAGSSADCFEKDVTSVTETLAQKVIGIVVKEDHALPWGVHKGCEERSMQLGENEVVGSSSLLLKVCQCKSRMCRKFLPADRSIL